MGGIGWSRYFSGMADSMAVLGGRFPLRVGCSGATISAMIRPDDATGVCLSSTPDSPAGQPRFRRMLLLGFGLMLLAWALCVYQAIRAGPEGAQRGDVIADVLGLLLTAAVGVVVLVRAGLLERRIREQQVKDAQTARHLQRLSACLVDALEEERRSVARELHDEIGQALTAIKMELSHAERTQTPDGMTGPLASAKAATEGALHTVRDLTRMLHPRILDELGLIAALETHVRDFSRRTGIPVDLTHDGVESRINPRVALCAYRVVQEALTNISRHAAATRCRVSLTRVRDAIRLTIEDNGKGFDPQAVAPGGGVGLLGIQERAIGCGGKWALETGPGRGTRVSVELPVRPPTPATAGTETVELT